MITTFTDKTLHILLLPEHGTSFVVQEVEPGKYLTVDNKEPSVVLNEELKFITNRIKDIDMDLRKLKLLKGLLDTTMLGVQMDDKLSHANDELNKSIKAEQKRVDTYNNYLEELHDFMIMVGCSEVDIEVSSIISKAMTQKSPIQSPMDIDFKSMIPLGPRLANPSEVYKDFKNQNPNKD